MRARRGVGADGVALVEAEMGEEEEEEEDAPAGVGGVVHPEDWKYLHVGTKSATALSAPL
jgi:hypothetical protein